MTRKAPELIPRPSATRLDRQNLDVREDVRQAVELLGLILPSEVIAEKLLRDNLFALVQGEYGGFVLSKPNTQVRAVSPGATVSRPVTIEASATLEGLTFQSSKANHDELIRVTSGAKVIFRGCTFIKREAGDTSTYVTVDAGCKVTFIGCRFVGSFSTGDAIANSAGATDVQLIGCSNDTGISFGTVTETGGI